MNWQPLILTFELAVITTVILFVISIPLAYWLAYSRLRFKPVFEALVGMPLVLPPTVLGFYLLVAFNPNNGFGRFLDTWFDLQLVFSFEGLVVASVIYSLPFMVQPLRSGFSQIPDTLRDAGRVMGKSRWSMLVRVLLPGMKPSILTGVVLAFAHTIGEFGVVLMIGGNLPGKTRVASIAIFDEVEALNYGLANTYSLILFAFTFTILLVVYAVNGRDLGNLTR